MTNDNVDTSNTQATVNFITRRRLAASAFQDKFAGLLTDNGLEMVGEDVAEVTLVAPDDWDFDRNSKNLFLPDPDRLTACMKINQGNKSEIIIEFESGTDRIISMCFDDMDVPESEMKKIRSRPDSPEDDNSPEP